MKFDAIDADYGELIDVTLSDGSVLRGTLSDITLDYDGSNDGDDEIDIALEDGRLINLMGVEVSSVARTKIDAQSTDGGFY